MLFVGGVAAIILVIIALFAFPIFSPIPYFPSNKKDLKRILDAINLKSDETLVDLGAGDGLVIFESARRHKGYFVADEINPVLFGIMYIRRLFHPNRKNIRVILKNMFKVHDTPLSGKLVFYLYVSPWFLEKIYAYLKKHFKNFRVVTYFYPIPSLKPKKVIEGVHKIYIY